MNLDEFFEKYGDINTFFYDEKGDLYFALADEDGIPYLNEKHVKVLDIDNQNIESWKNNCISLLKEKGFECDLYPIANFYDMYLADFYSGKNNSLFMDDEEQKTMYEKIKKYEHDVKNNPSNKELILEALSVCEYILGYISDELKKDKEFAKEVVKLSEMGIMFLDPIFQNDKELALEAVKNNGLSINGFGENIRNDLDVAISALKNNSNAYAFIGEQLKNDEIFRSKAEEENIDIDSIEEELDNNYDFLEQLYNSDL